MEPKRGIKEFLSDLFWPVRATLDFLQKYFKALIFLLLLLFVLASLPKEALKKPNLATVSLKGTILSAKETVQKLENLSKKSSIKGVLFIVDSPGGAVAPSLEISRAIKRLRAKKPVITYAAGTLASGSYYASIWSNKIIANPGSIVGSIGVILEVPNLKGLLDKVGVHPQVVKAGKYKEAGTPFRPWKEYERKELEKVIKDTYEMFVNDVAKARKLDLARQDRWAQAHIFTARQAKEEGLIDEVGTMYEAKKQLIKLSGVKKPVWQKEDKLEKFLKKISEETASRLSSLLFGLKAF
ncbi:MAG: signal peptide peptidase SppA [Epsilonproteobacteria bacterium]|nr:signal peptide peptidase SppA [Campylobacterota bacterium]NPA64117.1 signal peptide peptidase SppA [Campylobacterota bacterium]